MSVLCIASIRNFKCIEMFSVVYKNEPTISGGCWFLGCDPCLERAWRSSCCRCRFCCCYMGVATPATATVTLKPGLHEQHRHKDKFSTKTKHDICSGTCKDKTTRIFLCFSFYSALGLCLDYAVMLMPTTFMSQAWLHSFVLPFVLSLCLYLCSRVNQALDYVMVMR